MLEVLTFGSGILAIISCFLPFASVSIFGYSQSVSLMDGGDGIICIALVVVALILSYLHKDIVALGLAGATAVLAVYEFLMLNQYWVVMGIFLSEHIYCSWLLLDWLQESF